MKIFRAVLLATSLATASSALAAGYSTDALISFQKEEGTYSVDITISQLVERGGRVTEEVLAKPRILTSPGVPASLYHGPSANDPDYAKKENISVDVSWPYPNESGEALCSVLIKRGDKMELKSTVRLKIDGPGRTPLIVSPQDVDPSDVKVLEEKSNVYLFVKFTGKTKAEVKKLADENYGNKVQIKDSKGDLMGGGQSFGTYQETGMTVQYASKDEAEQAATILRALIQK